MFESRSLTKRVHATIPHTLLSLSTMASHPEPDASKGMAKVGEKHDRSVEDGDDESRRVAMRTENNDDEENLSATERIVLRGLGSSDETVRGTAFLNLLEILDIAHGAELSQILQDFFWVGGQYVLVRVMIENSSCEDIQEKGLFMISTATYNHRDLNIAFAKVGAMQAVLAAMDKFQSNWAIQLNGLEALANMTNENDANAVAVVVNLKGLPVILNAVDRFYYEENYAVSGCKVLKNLCRPVELRKPFFETNALGTLLKAGNYHETNDEIDTDVIEAAERFVLYRKTAKLRRASPCITM